MKLYEFINIMQNLAGESNPEVVLFNRDRDETLVVRPDDEQYDFEVLGGRDEIVIEF